MLNTEKGGEFERERIFSAPRSHCPLAGPVATRRGFAVLRAPFGVAGPAFLLERR